MSGHDRDSRSEPRTWQVYLLRCADMSLYCGITTDLARRLKEHNAGTASRCTRARRPVIVAAAVTAPDKSAALRLEARIKKAPAEQKIDLLKALGAEDALPRN